MLRKRKVAEIVSASPIGHLSVRRLDSDHRGCASAVKRKVSTEHKEVMNACETCGNEYDKPLEIVANGISHYFDCFECAIHGMAPECDHCGVKIIGHGIESGGTMFCCAHCAAEEGVMAAKDRV
jgi:hypothetical protein